MTRSELKKQEKAILSKAKECGVQGNFFFETTFRRYQVQMSILEDLEVAISEHGMTVEKEYVKGRKNLMTNPAITEYNRTSTAANGTVVTLMKIIDSFAKSGDSGGERLQKMMAALHNE